MAPFDWIITRSKRGPHGELRGHAMAYSCIHANPDDTPSINRNIFAFSSAGVYKNGGGAAAEQVV
jgi:hypothetical protein